MQWMTLFKKEMHEKWHNKMVIWFPLLFILLMIMDPLTYYFLPELMKMVGGVPEGVIFELPELTATEVIFISLEQMSFLGTITIGLITMGTIAGERKSGLLEMMLTKPISSLHFIMSKWISYALLIVGAFFIGLLSCIYYVAILYEQLPLTAILQIFFFYSVWLIFVLSISFFYNSFIRTPGVVLALTITTLACLSLLNQLFGHVLTMFPSQLSHHLETTLLTGTINRELIGTASVTTCCSVLLVLLAIFLFEKSELI